MNRVDIDSIDDGRVKEYVSLTNVQLRSKLEPEKGIFIAEGAKVIDRALLAGYEPVSFFLEEKWLPSMEEIFFRVDRDFPETTTYVASHETIEQIAGYEVTRGALAAFRRKPELLAADLIRNSQRLIVLEAITNASNVGAIFRSAAALNIDGILLDDTCCDPLYRRSLRVSMGCALFVPWARFGRKSNYPALFDQLRNDGFTTVALALRPTAVSLRDVDFSTLDKAALFVGTEGEGLSDDIVDRCDLVVEIPMAEPIDSLNVVGATAIACWELSRR